MVMCISHYLVTSELVLHIQFLAHPCLQGVLFRSLIVLLFVLHTTHGILMKLHTCMGRDLVLNFQ